jgi:DNA-binding NtrC family response regulator
MSILLIAQDQVSLNEIGAQLRGQGVKSLSTFRLKDVIGGSWPVETTNLTIVVSGNQRSSDEAEAVDQIRQKLGPDRTLVACILRPSEIQAQTLYKVGVNEIICPSGSHTTLLAERIQAYLILEGYVTPFACDELHGATAEMKKIFEDIDNYAPLREAVLIRGETGTGKGLVARALHRKGKRDGKFIKIECVAINPNLMESELFGHVKGSFSDAKSDRTGLIEAASDGTAFVDEIGDLDLSLQKKLLGVVEDRVIRRVGDNADRPINTRFVFATHCILEEGIREKTFREDLYARINRLIVELPPLREHRADIPLLVKHLLKRFNVRNHTEVEIATGAVDELFHYDWPLNVRELDDVVCRAAAKMKVGQLITDVTLRESIRDPRELRTTHARKYAHTFSFDPLDETWPKMSERAKHEYFKSLGRVARDMDHAIALSGIQRAQLYRIIAAYNLKIKS